MFTLCSMVLYFEISLKPIMLFLGIVLLISPILDKWVQKITYKILPFEKELHTYEKDKFRNEWNKMERTRKFLQMLVGVLLIKDVKNDTYITTAFSAELLKIMLLVMIVLVILLNISLYYHNRKIDKRSSETLQSFNRDRFIFSAFIAIIYIVILSTISFIIN